MTDTTKCRRCGAEVEGGALFCSRCGQDMTLLGDDTPTLEVTTAGTPVVPVRSTMRQALRDATLGEYEILSELGRGGMATVFLAHDIALDRKVAIKVMAPHLLEGEGMAERFKLEARTAAQLSHPHIIPIYAVKETAETLFFVMKYVEGRGLDDVIRKTGPMPIPMVKDILSKVGSALGYAHRRDVVHRDIKPANIMIDDEGTPIVTDFGIAKVAETKGLTMTGTTIGTPSYMSPEQCEARPVTGASDQYSLGIVAFEMLTGRLPFEGSSAVTTMYKHCHDPLPPLEDFRPDCPPEMRETIVRMAAKKPDERWPSLEAAVRRLANESTPTTLDPIRSQLMELVKEGDADQLLAKLSDPSGPAVKVSGPRSGGHAAPPAKRRTGTLAAAAVVVVAIGGTLAVLRPWAAAPAGDAGGVSAQPVRSAPAPGPDYRTVAPQPGADAGDGATPVGDPGATDATPSQTASTPAEPPPADQPTSDAAPTPPPAAPPTVATVEITGGPAGPLLPGGTATLRAQPLDPNGRTVSGQSVRWTSSDEDVARIDASGSILAVGPGRAELTAVISGVSASYAVSVGEAPVSSVTLDAQAVTLEIGEQETLRAQTHAGDGSDLSGRQVTWSSSDPSVARVSAAGVVSGAGEGTATITASSEGQSARAGITVRVPMATAVDAIVAAYAGALQSKSIDRIREVYPGLTPEQEQNLRRSLPSMDGLRIDYTIDSLQEQTSQAAAAVTATYRFRSGGRDYTQPTHMNFTFARTTTSWRLTSIVTVD